MTITRIINYSDAVISEKAVNNILTYTSRELQDHYKTIISSSIVDNSINIFLFALISLFSALEEADWMIFSAHQVNNDNYIDDTVWNIEKLGIKFLNNLRHTTSDQEERHA
tara:strand:- start:358 stop:690 length:333 start_codon:yes stop_codon:yes gene_type:complete